MRRVVWSNEALADFDNQINYIALENQQNAALVADRVQNAVESLRVTPTGRAGRVSGTYERLVLKTSLIIVYKLSGDGGLAVVRIIHAARNWPAEQWPED